MMVPQEQDVILVPVIRLGHVANQGHVGTAVGLVPLVQIHAPLSLAQVDHGLWFERHGTGLYIDAFAWGSSDTN
jgi:hypothetical protein